MCLIQVVFSVNQLVFLVNMDKPVFYFSVDVLPLTLKVYGFVPYLVLVAMVTMILKSSYKGCA